MIPESTMKKLIEEFLIDRRMTLPIPASTEDLASQLNVAEPLARYITVNSLKALKDEDAPEAAVLQAACIVLTDYIQRNRGVELLENGPGVVAIFPIVDPDEHGTLISDGLMCPNVAKALIQFAEKVAAE